MSSERQIFAALANPQARELYARVVLGQLPEEPTAKEKRGIAQLERAGLIARPSPAGEGAGRDAGAGRGGVEPDDGLPSGGEGTEWAAVEVTDIFAELLSAGRTQQPTGYERFLQNGRVERWPSKARDKHGLILWIMERCIDEGETLTEKELNERISRFSDDPALIRRYCVDLGALERTPDGAAYRRAESFPREG